MDNTVLLKAFPGFLRKEVLSSLEKTGLIDDLEQCHTFSVTLRGEKLEIPYRVYFEEPAEHILTPLETLSLNCLLTRHHNGFVREKYLRKILSGNEYWAAPFIVQLLGEYVVEILRVIEEKLTPKHLENIRAFVSENPKFYELTKSRITSYWDCYYRRLFPDKKNYSGYKQVSRSFQVL